MSLALILILSIGPALVTWRFAFRREIRWRRYHRTIDWGEVGSAMAMATLAAGLWPLLVPVWLSIYGIKKLGMDNFICLLGGEFRSEKKARRLKAKV